MSAQLHRIGAARDVERRARAQESGRHVGGEGVPGRVHERIRRAAAIHRHPRCRVRRARER